MNLNKVLIVGRLTQDPETRTTTGGQSVTSFSVATNRIWNNKQGERQEQTEFHNVVAWQKLGEICGQYLKKGQETLVTGRLQTRSWEDKEGKKNYRTEIIAEEVNFGAKAGGGQSRTGDKPSPAPKKEEQSPKAQTPPKENKEEEIDIEDIPF